MKSLPQSCEDCFKEYQAALEDLNNFAHRADFAKLTDSQSRELIMSFEVTHELALKVIQKYFEKQGKGPFSGSRDATVEAFHADLIDDGKIWLDMVIDRIQYNPVYPIDTQGKFLENIQKRYIPALGKFEETIDKILN